MDTHQKFCPVAQAAEIITRRWMPLVIRELLCGSHRFNDLHRGLPRMSRTLLARRLQELEAEGIVERRLVGADQHPEYHLTPAGEELRPIIFQLGFWGKRWVQREIARDEYDAGVLMWDIQRRIHTERLPDRRVIVYFHFPDAISNHQHFWLVLEDEEVDLCLHDPGQEEDLYVRADVRTLTQVWLGDLSFTRAQQEGGLRLGGDREIRQAFPNWLGLSLFASMARQPRRTAPTVPAP